MDCTELLIGILMVCLYVRRHETLSCRYLCIAADRENGINCHIRALSDPVEPEYIICLNTIRLRRDTSTMHSSVLRVDGSGIVPFDVRKAARCGWISLYGPISEGTVNSTRVQV
jgi:hypothetical protein